MVVRSWERSAVDVNVRADASNSVEAEETVSMISPTALSKIVCELDHVGLALPGAALFGRQLVGLHPFDLKAVGLEHFHGARHLADFVATLGAGNIRFQIVAGEGFHHGLELADRPGQALGSDP